MPFEILNTAMTTAEEHNLKKASDHAKEAAARLQTIDLGNTTSLTGFEEMMIDAYKTHIKDIKKSIDEIRGELAERHEQKSTAA